MVKLFYHNKIRHMIEKICRAVVKQREQILLSSVVIQMVQIIARFTRITKGL